MKEQYIRQITENGLKDLGSLYNHLVLSQEGASNLSRNEIIKQAIDTLYHILEHEIISLSTEK